MPASENITDKLNMKTTTETKTTRKLALAQPQSQPVHLEFTNPAARRVCIAGTFNNWQPEKAEMISLRGGKWAKDLMLPPGAYEYRFVVDGCWIADPKAAHVVPNPFGEMNSILTVPPEAPTRWRAANRPTG
jgi:1,4-alpha-glucan branching enzyme